MRAATPSRAVRFRGALVAPLLFATALGAGGCGVLPITDGLDLARTSWRVTTINDEPAVFPFTMSFNKDGRDGLVTLGTPCGPIELYFDRDGVGDAIFFSGAYPELSCNHAAQAATSDFIDALAAVRSVGVGDHDHVLLDGPWRLALRRQP